MWAKTQRRHLDRVQEEVDLEEDTERIKSSFSNFKQGERTLNNRSLCHETRASIYGICTVVNRWQRKGYRELQ